MPGPGQRVKYPRGRRGFWGLKGSKIARSKREKEETPQKVKGGGAGGGRRKPTPPWKGSKGGRVGKAHGGAVSARLSKSGPVAKAN